jgi:hypothetical protein
VGQSRERKLQPSSDVAQADWVREGLVGFAEGVYSVVPGGFLAYIRLFHPAYDGGWEDRPLRWSEVAQRAGTTMHALAQFDPLLGRVDEEAEEWEVAGPDKGNLEPDVLRALCEVLAEHTTTPDRCWFSLWYGYGWVHGAVFVTHARAIEPGSPPPPEPERREAPAPLFGTPVVAPAPQVPPRPLVELPGRQYLLFSGPLDAALDATWGGLGRDSSDPQSPNLFWPEDRAWCVATEIDLDSTYIGCSEQAAEALLADPRLETWRVQAEDPITADSDWINGSEGDPPHREPPTNAAGGE